MIKTRKKILRWLAFLISGSFALILIGLGVFYFVAQTYLNKNLSDFVHRKSKGNYELSFENLQLNFSQWGIELNQAKFNPSDSIIKLIDTSGNQKQFYSFSSPDIRIDGIQLFKLIFSKKLEIAAIVISEPELQIHGRQSDSEKKEDNIGNILQELRPLVTRTFKSIKINRIELTHASFDFYNLLGDTRKLANAEDISIGVNGFYTDSVLLPNPDRLFDADDIFVRMHNYQNKLADSIHLLRAETATYSLKRSVIDARNIELKPIHPESLTHNKYQVFVPALRVTSSQIKEFYRNNALPVDSLILTDAKIKYWPGQKTEIPGQKQNSGFDLYELIKDEFQGINIQHFVVSNAGLQLYKTALDTAFQQELKNITFTLDDFKLDSESEEDTSRVFYSKNIKLSASGYELILGDNTHHIKVEKLNLSTQKRSVLVQNINIFPLKQSQNQLRQENTIEASCDSVRLDLFDFKKAFHQKRFGFQKINLFNPEVKLTRNEEVKDDTLKGNNSFIYNLISIYAKGIYASQVSVQQGKIQLVNQTGVIQTGNTEATVKLWLTGFALDEVSAKNTDRLFYANQIELRFGNYQMQLVDQLHKLTIESFTLSTRKNQARMENLHLSPVSKENMEELLRRYNRSELYEFTVPLLTMSQTNFHEAFFNKKLSIDTLAIQTPNIYYENFAFLKQDKPKADFADLFELLSDYLENIQIHTVQIPNGTILLINHNKKEKTISLNNQFNLKLENTLINKDQLGKKRLLFSEFVDFSVRDHLINLSDKVHVLKAGEIGFSTREREIYVMNARLYPESNSKDFSSVLWNIQLLIPEIRIKGINMEEFYFDRKIDADNFAIRAPEIKLYQKRKQVNSKDIKEVEFPLPEEIESIAIRQFNLNDGSLKIFSEMTARPYLLVQSDLKMTAQDILIRKNISGGNPEFIKGSYTGKLVQFRFTPKDKNQQLDIDELLFSTSNRSITASNLLLKAKTKNIKEDQFELRIPSLSMTGFDIDNAYKRSQFSFESILVEKPFFQLFNNAKDSVKINPFRVDLYPHVESFADVFATRSIKVNDATVVVQKNGKEKLREKLNFNLSNMKIDKNPSQGFLHATDFSFSTPRVEKQGKLYQYSIGETSYSSTTDRFVARDIQIKPLYDAKKHQEMVGFQSDYFSGKIDSVTIDHPDVKRWFDRNEIAGRCLKINSLALDIFRNKQIPFDESRRPKMIHDLIKGLKYPVSIDSLVLSNAGVTYAELPENADSEGEIRFSKIHARLAPFTNLKSSSGSVPDFLLTGRATLMDSCDLNVVMNFRMNSPENSFNAKGHLSPFNMHIINPVIEPLAMISIRSGHVDRFDFNFSADRNKATGQLYFGYNDLKISVLELKNGNTKAARLASFLANSLMLRSKNPRGKDFLPEEINFTRDQKRSDLNFWWKSIFSGVKNTLDIKENKADSQE